MSDKFFPISIEQLVGTILKRAVITINQFWDSPSKLFFNPQKDNRLATEIFGQQIATPLGVCSRTTHPNGAEQSIAAWLMGCRILS
jgi:hypothetical protein